MPDDSATRPPTPSDPYQTQAAPSDESVDSQQRFKILRLHQKGGLGRVSIALDEELHREIALKEILAAHADNEENRTRFVREAEITGALEHPGIVPGLQPRQIRRWAALLRDAIHPWYELASRPGRLPPIGSRHRGSTVALS